ncbi:hypothetical protein pclt_cds_768 [Pandoravirus celtis]|uniref:Uncharacterized protein n=1 Tax=Pandoravirus celtis TaxID=2568002 RepID=A0A4D6EHR2_9VIRU|nr:hypothetical protein pclt_cds_768 [Pandoravirus celtis]
MIVASRDARRVVRRRIESGAQDYADAINPDLQYEIMQTLFRLDPLDALRLAASDRQHWQILESIESSIVRASALMPTDVPITAHRLLAANIGFSRRLGGGTSPQDWEAAVAASLMEGFVRFLFTGGCVTLAAARTQRDSIAHARYTEYDTTHAGDAVTGGFGAFLAKHRQSKFRTLLPTRGVCRGYFSRHDYQKYLLHLEAVGVRVGNHPRRLWRASLARPSTEGLALQPISPFPKPMVALSRRDRPRRAPAHVARSASGEMRTAPIGSQTPKPPSATIWTNGAPHMVGPCAQIQAAGDLGVPTFSDFFPGAIYLANMVPDVAMMMDLRSPRIERLLGKAFQY